MVLTTAGLRFSTTAGLRV